MRKTFQGNVLIIHKPARPLYIGLHTYTLPGFEIGTIAQKHVAELVPGGKPETRLPPINQTPDLIRCKCAAWVIQFARLFCHHQFRRVGAGKVFRVAAIRHARVHKAERNRWKRIYVRLYKFAGASSSPFEAVSSDP